MATSTTTFKKTFAQVIKDNFGQTEKEKTRAEIAAIFNTTLKSFVNSLHKKYVDIVEFEWLLEYIDLCQGGHMLKPIMFCGDVLWDFKDVLNKHDLSSLKKINIEETAEMYRVRHGKSLEKTKTTIITLQKLSHAFDDPITTETTMISIWKYIDNLLKLVKQYKDIIIE